MGILGTALGMVGFGWGVGIGVVVGYFIFIYTQPNDVKDPIVRPMAELDSKSLLALLPEIPLWVKNPDYDRSSARCTEDTVVIHRARRNVDWLNKFIRDLWPYLDKAICKIIREQAKPYMDEYGTKYKWESIDFEHLTLGALPPTFVGIKVYDTQEKEIIMEPSVKFAGNPNIVLAVKAFGMKATVQLVDVQVFATPRVTLKPLIDTFPCFSKIVVSLMEKPFVDFGLKLLGGDVMAIPGLYKVVQDIISDQVANLYLWPKNLEISVVDDASAAKKPVGILTVKVVKAKGLKKKDMLGKSDPYVKMFLGGGQNFAKVTRTMKSNLNPEWNETFKLIVNDPQSQSLELHVYDWDKIGAHERLGMQLFDLKDLIPEENITKNLDLFKSMDTDDPQNSKSRGQLTVDLHYKPFSEDDAGNLEEDDEGGFDKAPEGTPAGGGLFVVIIHEAEEVEGKHHTNPFVRVLFKGEEKRTKPIKKNRDPRWEERFEWVLDEPPTNDRIHVEVMSKSFGVSMHLKESLGYVDINLSDVVNNKRINERYQLFDSKSGKIQVELQWRPS